MLCLLSYRITRWWLERDLLRYWIFASRAVGLNSAHDLIRCVDSQRGETGKFSDCSLVRGFIRQVVEKLSQQLPSLEKGACFMNKVVRTAEEVWATPSKWFRHDEPRLLYGLAILSLIPVCTDSIYLTLADVMNITFTFITRHFLCRMVLFASTMYCARGSFIFLILTFCLLFLS